MDIRERYISPFSTRYASDEMQYIFSEKNRVTTWRKLWVALARAEKKLGLAITDEQIAELAANVENIDFDLAAEREAIVKHDVMAQLYAYCKVCPTAAPIIHLGATSCYVGDNTELIVMREGLQLIVKKLVQVIKNLSEFAVRYKGVPCLAYTHLQPAQLTTVGKRATLWINELVYDLDELEHRLNTIELLGCKGTTGTQASFLELFDGNEELVKQLDGIIAKEMGFDRAVSVSGQTYSRKIDAMIMSALSGIAQSAYKFSNDMRILQAFEELEEPFEKNQVGSSAMPYKRNPMRSERMSALARYVISNSVNPAFTAGTQWFERTLDDSANKRIAMSEGFLAVDAILNLYINISSDIVVYERIIERRVREKLPFMATENILMRAVKKGGNRQELHERLREHSHEAVKAVRLAGGTNDLLERIAKDTAFMLDLSELEQLLMPERYVGISISQTEDFIREIAEPLIKKYNTADIQVQLKV